MPIEPAVDPLLMLLAAVSISVLIIGVLLSFFKQPYVIGYILAGILLGPFGLAIISEKEVAAGLGSIGVVLLLFFVGMEIHLPKIISNWRVAILGTLFQAMISVIVLMVIGTKLGLPLSHGILLGFVISLSSTAVVIKLLQDWGELNTKLGQNVVGVLIVQDLIVTPMLIILSFMGSSAIIGTDISLQIVGGIMLTALLIWVLRKRTIELPLTASIKGDHELQVFYALALCFGFAALAALTGISAALGAFVAGIMISAAKETQWVHEKMEDFRVLFVALFFVSIGLLMDLKFIENHLWVIMLIVAVVFVLKTFMNALILRFLGDSWKESFYSGALLSQIGEFSFVLGAVGMQTGIINDFIYQSTIAVISLTLLFSPFWIYFIKKLTIEKKTAKDIKEYF